MRSTACDLVCALIDREAIGWTEAERLRVEQHLAECASCSETLSLSRFVRNTLKEASGELSESARSRAIRNALTASARRTPSLRVQVQKSWPRWTLGLSLSAAAAALVIWLAHTPEAQVATRLEKPVAAPQQESVAERERAPEQASAEPVIVESTAEESRRLAHADVRFAANTRARFEPATRTLALSAGEVDVDVDPSKGESFAVVTQSFRVEVLGTRFSVTPEMVTVVHGRVRVLDTQGVVLIGALGAGESFSLSEHAQHPAKGSKKPAARVPVASEAPLPDAKALLSEARAAMVRDDRGGARALIQKAEGARPSRNDRAEAATLRAELALLERDDAGALRSYRAIAAQYGELPAGENAAFAAAQLAARSAPDQARALLEAYLERYPNGRFVSQAKQRLERLGAR